MLLLIFLPYGKRGLEHQLSRNFVFEGRLLINYNWGKIFFAGEIPKPIANLDITSFDFFCSGILACLTNIGASLITYGLRPAPCL